MERAKPDHKNIAKPDVLLEVSVTQAKNSLLHTYAFLLLLPLLFDLTSKSSAPFQTWKAAWYHGESPSLEGRRARSLTSYVFWSLNFHICKVRELDKYTWETFLL